jgi:hypothetical protein
MYADLMSEREKKKESGEERFMHGTLFTMGQIEREVLMWPQHNNYHYLIIGICHVYKVNE